ncbi:hypothetical protein FRB99_001891 [Tulasnella sp. 403]|nr:hypothetical protein FRB99_001891 [Tulasnella sp. 403]
MSSGHVELSKQYFSLAEVAYQRAQPPNSSSSRPMLSLDVIEYLLIKFHYLTLRLEAGEINGSGTTDIERIWKVRGILVSMAVAMGLHRDPAQWKKFGKEERDRRRWAWWNILGVDRWQSLLLGRPLSVANHSFDTSHPSGTLSSASSQSPSAPSSQASPAATTTSLRLTQLMGDVIDDATSIRPVPYERIMAHDRALQSLLETLDDEGSSTKTAMAKAAVLHVRIALHRPFVTTSQSQHHTGHHGLQHQQSQQAARTKSIELAVRAAESLIHTFVQAVSVASTSPGIKPSPTPVPFSYSTQSSPVQSPIHPTLQSPYQKQQLTTLALHTFAACTVLSSILIHPPQHVGSPSSQYRHQNHHQLRQTLRAALHSLSGIKGAVPMAERSWRVLSSLRPLWDEGGERIDHARRRECWDAVTKSQFPYISGFGGAFGGFAMERRGSASSSTRSGNGSASASPPAGTTPSSSSSTSCSSSQGLGMANPSVSPATSMSSNGGSVHGVGAGDGMSMSLTTPNPVVHGIAGYSPPTHQQPTSTNSILISPYNPTPANAPGGAVLIAPPTITTTGLPPASMSTVTSPQTAHPASSAQYLAAGTEYFDMSGYATATPVDVADAWPASLGLYQNAGVAPDWAGIVDGLAGAGAMSRQGSMSSRGYLG